MKGGTMKEIIISGKGICKTFSGKGVKNQVLNHIDADIYKGDFTVIMGASGQANPRFYTV